MPVEDAFSAYYDTLHSEEDNAGQAAPDPFMEQLVQGTINNLADLDSKITAKASHWRIERMPVVDRNVLRLAVYEMVKLGTPRAVVIDEAIELARQFSGDESVAFVNGVLDAVRKDLPPEP